MEVAPKKSHVSRYAHEDEHFWQKHTDDFSRSSLSISKYCQMAGVNYDRFIYWRKKLTAPPKHPSSLLPIQIKPERKGMDTLLCSLNLKHGGTLKIHDERALLLILERLA